MTYAIVQLLTPPKHSLNKTTGKESYQAAGYVFPHFPLMVPAMPYKFYVEPAFRDFVGFGMVNMSVTNGQYDSLEITKYGHVFVPLTAEQHAQLTAFLSPIAGSFESLRNSDGPSPVATGSTMEVQMLQQQMAQQALAQAEFNKQMLEMMRNNGNAPAPTPNHAAPVTTRPETAPALPGGVKNPFENAVKA